MINLKSLSLFGSLLCWMTVIAATKTIAYTSGTRVTVVFIRIKEKVLKFNSYNGHVQNLREKYSNSTFDYENATLVYSDLSCSTNI